jgi:uncharacterized phage protein (TIGR01671 family)
MKLKVLKEVKFRCWNAVDEKMYKVLQIIFPFDGGDGFVYYEKFLSNGERRVVMQKLSDDDIILLQYTGLKDSDRKEIYEGDVVEHWQYNDEKMKEIIVVENLQDFLKFVGVREREYGEDWSNGEEYIKVLGNIYENPELLKEVK